MSNYWEIRISGDFLKKEKTHTANSTEYDSEKNASTETDDTAEPFGETEDIRDIISQILFENFPCEGVVLEEETFKEFKRTGRADAVRAFFSQMPDIEVVRSTINNNLAEPIEFSLEIKQIENKDWSEEWKKGWLPTKISERIVICPTWRDYEPNAGEITINLDPGMAFGTGTHATTQLCVRAMEKYMPVNAELADIGCGSGILAICGIKLGAKNAVAVDNDPTVIPIAKDNATLNNVEDKIRFFEATSKDLIGKKYDFICANILHNVLDAIMNELKQLLKPDGKMVLSGILDEKEHIVQSAVAREGLTVEERLTNGNWVGLVVKK